MHLFPYIGPIELGNEKQLTSIFSEYRTYDVSLYSNAYLKIMIKKWTKLDKQSITLT
jgi:hypothetical protein